MMASTTDVQSSASPDYDYHYDYGDVYMYPGYKFERPVYLYIWEILVIIMFFQNILALLVFLHRTMRTPTNVILSAIAISDSLTGLVTLPTYIMVYQKYDPLPVIDYEAHFVNYSQHIANTGSRNRNISNNLNILDIDKSPVKSFNISSINSSTVSGNGTILPEDYNEWTHPPVDGYTLSKNLCRGFMISKYFLSKSFHTISIFLTLFLEIQRYVSMAYPYRFETCFNKYKAVKIYCILTFILCPCLHMYHLGNVKAVDGMCQWELSGNGCENDCIFLWISFIVRHFIPCVILLIFTSLFICELRKGQKNFRRIDGHSKQYLRRIRENRRVSFIVTTVVIVRLIPEIPYSVFLLDNSIKVTENNGKGIDLEVNRIFHMCYEVCLVSSFLANFYIYLIVNKTFRKRLYRTFVVPVKKQFTDSLSFYELQSWYPSRRVKIKAPCPEKPAEKIDNTTNQEP